MGSFSVRMLLAPTASNPSKKNLSVSSSVIFCVGISPASWQRPKTEEEESGSDISKE